MLLRTFSKVYGLAGLRVGFALCGSARVRHRRRPGPPAVLLQRRRAGRGDRGAAAPGRGRRARRARGRRARRDRRAGCASSASSPPSRRRTSAGSHLPGHDGEEPPRSSADVVEGSPSAACSCAPARALGREGALRVTYGTPRAERALPRRAGRGARALESVCGVRVARPWRSPRSPVHEPALARPQRPDVPRWHGAVRLRLRLSTPGDLARRSAGRIVAAEQGLRAGRRTLGGCAPSRTPYSSSTTYARSEGPQGMLIVMKPQATEQEIQAVIDRVESGRRHRPPQQRRRR